MINDSFPVLSICCCCFLGTLSLVATIGILNEKLWTFYLISIGTNSSDPELVDLDFQVERISRNVFALSGTWKQNYDVTYDTYVDVRVYRSATGTSEYREISYGITNRTFFEYMNTIYKDFFMRDIAKCSNFIQFEKKLVPPIEKKVYEMKQCQVTNKQFPQYMPDGFYKLVGAFSGGPDGPYLSIELLLKVENKV